MSEYNPDYFMDFNDGNRFDLIVKVYDCNLVNPDPIIAKSLHDIISMYIECAENDPKHKRQLLHISNHLEMQGKRIKDFINVESLFTDID